MKKGLERGAVLPVALMILLILLLLAIGFTYETQTQASFNASAKLGQVYHTAAENALNRSAAILQENWLTAAGDTSASAADWRLGGVFKGTQDPSGYGVLLDSSLSGDGFGSEHIILNGGLVELDYRVFLSNNRDDPTFLMASTLVNINGVATPIDGTFDGDGKAVLTVQVFPLGSSDTPLTTISSMVQATGVRLVDLGLDIGSEGDDLSTSLNAGEGSGDAGTMPGGAQGLSLSNYDTGVITP